MPRVNDLLLPFSRVFAELHLPGRNSEEQDRNIGHKTDSACLNQHKECRQHELHEAVSKSSLTYAEDYPGNKGIICIQMYMKIK